MTADRIHATTVVIGGKGVLITGSSGAGKSDLALRLIDRGAKLVADDQTCLAVTEGKLIAAPVPGFAGRMEIRGLGIMERPHVPSATVALHVDLETPPDRLPEPATRTFSGISVRTICVDSRAPSAPLIVEIALT